MASKVVYSQLLLSEAEADSTQINKYKKNNALRWRIRTNTFAHNATKLYHFKIASIKTRRNHHTIALHCSWADGGGTVQESRAHTFSCNISSFFLIPNKLKSLYFILSHSRLTHCDGSMCYFFCSVCPDCSRVRSDGWIPT